MSRHQGYQLALVRTIQFSNRQDPAEFVDGGLAVEQFAGAGVSSDHLLRFLRI
jgi:hypothetical protein